MPSLAIKLTADTAEFQSDMGKAAQIAERDMERLVARAAAAGELIGKALGAAATNFSRLVQDTLKAGDEIAKFTQRVGWAQSAVSELVAAGELENVTVRQLTGSLGNFNRALAEAQNENTKAGQTFRALGVDITQGPQVAFEQFVKSVRTLDPETRSAAMRVAFKEGSDALIPFIEKLDEARDRAKRLGIVMSADLVRDSERFNDAMTTIHASSRALAITALTPASGALATMAENLVTAKERGTNFKDTAAEIGKVFVATHGTILSYVPLWGEALERAAQRAFDAIERVRARAPIVEGGRVEGARAIGGQLAGPPDPPDKQQRVACAVSGGKWENGACVYKRGSATGRSPRDPSMNAEQIARQEAREAEEEAKAISEAMSFVPRMTERLERFQRLVNAWGEDTFLGMSLEDAEAWVKNVFEGIDALDQIEDASKRVAAGFTEDGKAVSESSKKTTDDMVEFWRRGAETIQQNTSSLLLDMMDRKFDGLGRRWKRLIDQMVADTLAAKFNTALFGADFGKSGKIGGLIGQGLEWLMGGGSNAAAIWSDGAGAALVAAPGGGMVPALAGGTPMVRREGLAYLHPGERVLTREENRSYSRGSAIEVHNHFYGRVDRASVDQAAVATGRSVQRSLDRNT